MRHAFPRGLALCAALLLSPAAMAGNLTCKMNYSLSGWSAFYKTASGTGTVKCSNGQSLPVRIETKGGGVTFGKYKIVNGFGEFANVGDIRDVIGSYATAEAHAAAEKSASAQAMTNGKVSLALSGKGKGWSLGVAFSKFTIEAN
ncbi:MAG: hypothetical protein KF800_11635 [Lysobacter sp.]|nr:hypothetical protein [Lysobacter sp.]